PGAANLTGNISVTLVLAGLTLLFTLFSGRQTYWLHIVDPLGKSMPWAGKLLLYIILWPVEIIGIFTKPFSLLVRLFANITAGHILILSILSLVFSTQSLAVGMAGAVFATIMNMLELFVAVLQAYVFTLLSAMYFGQAVEEHH
ncbi:MAG: F0F1 ATP synthase subunit A, partial [Ekhidna sp.]